MLISPPPFSLDELQEQVAFTKAQVAAYQQELQRLIEAENLKAQELAIAYQQLQSINRTTSLIN